MAEAHETQHTRTASYLAEPGEVSRVLLLYSGGLDTSVMLKWIQDEYDAEVVALTVNLGQPGEDYDVVQGKAIHLGAVAAEVVDAREEFARDFVVPAIKANAIYGLAYPLFTALGRRDGVGGDAGGVGVGHTAPKPTTPPVRRLPSPRPPAPR